MSNQIYLQAAKLILDDYFTNEEFLKSTDAITMVHADSMIPLSHQIPTQPSDSGVNLDFLTRCSSGVNMLATHALDDEVFAHETSPPLTGENNIVLTSSSSIESSSSSNTVTEQQPLTPNSGLSRSKRSHFSRKDSTPENKNKSEGEKFYYFFFKK